MKNIFSEMENEQELKHQDVLKSVQEFYDKCERFRHISETAFPEVQQVCDRAFSEAKRVNKALHVEIIRKNNSYRLMDMFKALRKNVKVQ